MSDVKISVRFRWKTGTYGLTSALLYVLVNNLLNKISGNCFIFHNQTSLSCILSKNLAVIDPIKLSLKLTCDHIQHFNLLFTELLSFYMFMGKQMILTIFIISIAFGTKTELQIRIIQFCPSTNRTFVACDTFRLLYLTVIRPLPVYFFWRYTAIVACTEKENQEIQNRCDNSNSASPA